MAKQMGAPVCVGFDETGMTILLPGALQAMTEFAWLERANRNARKGKRYRDEVRYFQEDLEGNLFDIQQDVRQGTYRTGGYRRIWVKVPKKRLVMALPYRDRVVQWAAYQMIMPFYNRQMIEDSYACRVGKGSHKAVERLQYWLRQIDRSENPNWYYLKLDISKYFYRVDHAVLLRILGRRIRDPELMTFLERIINNPREPFGLPPGMGPGDLAFESWLYDVGMPIGNLLSQMFANIVLNELDQYCKHALGVRHYIRYMDDVIILGDDKAELQRVLAAVERFLKEELHLDLNGKTTIRPVSMGIEFVGRRVWATHSLLRKSTARRMKREVRSITEQVVAGVLTREEFERRIASIRGMLDHTESAALRWRLNEIVYGIAGDDYGELPFGRGNSDRTAVRSGSGTGGNYQNAA